MARKRQGSEILEGWQEEGVGGEDFLRGVVERVVQQVLEAEMTSFLGAGSYERGPERRGWRNGYKPRTLKTRVGELELMVPKDRDGEFQTELFERYQRSERWCWPCCRCTSREFRRARYVRSPKPCAGWR